MRLIPVVDLQHGKVVLGVGGQRKNYRPITTPLSESATFQDVADGLLRLFPCPSLYVADLDAIEGVGSHAREISAFVQGNRKINVWLDSGLQDISIHDLEHVPQNQTVVVGTEKFLATAGLGALLPQYNDRLVLSLDFLGSQFLGPEEFLTRSDLWPSRVIVMTLDAVGRNQGPNFDKVSEIVERAGAREVYAAGGVSSLADLKKLNAIGAAGALVASALHNGKIKTGDLKEIAGF